jgi:hypothetical protein
MRTPLPEEQFYKELREQMMVDLWRQDRHQHYHLRLLQVQAGADAVHHILPAGPKGQFAALVGAGAQFAASTTATAPANAAARQIVEQLPEMALITAPTALAKSIGQEWQRQRRSGAQAVSEDIYFSRTMPLALSPSEHIRQARPMPRQKTVEEMAFCWLGVMREQRPAQQFTDLLERSNALLWKEGDQPVSAFLVHTQLDRRQVVLGHACGEGDQIEALFNNFAVSGALPVEKGIVTVVADASSHAQHARLLARGYRQHKELRFTTLALG